MLGFLEWWGGIGYLLNKIFLYIAEKSHNHYWRVAGWAVYILGLPAWVVILLEQRYWVVAGVEAGGLPGMFLGLYVAVKQLKEAPKTLDNFCKWTVYIMLGISVIWSMIDYGGLTSFTQILEISLVAGFLFGTWFLGKKKATGWLWFMLMNGSNVILQFVKGRHILAVQQIISLIFDILGYNSAKKITGAK